MKIVRVGGRRINLEYLILADEWDGTADAPAMCPGDVLVTLERGKEFTLHDAQARAFLLAVDAEVESAPLSTPLPTAVGRAYDPRTGEPLPGVVADGEQGGP